MTIIIFFYFHEVERIVKGERRHRYIGFHITFFEQNQVLTKSGLIHAIRQHTQVLFSKDPKELGLWLVQFNGTTGIIKCRSQEKEHTIALLQSLENIEGKSVTVTTRSTSGTIHGLKQKE